MEPTSFIHLFPKKCFNFMLEWDSNPRSGISLGKFLNEQFILPRGITLLSEKKDDRIIINVDDVAHLT
jgi:hypothetical protein